MPTWVLLGHSDQIGLIHAHTTHTCPLLHPGGWMAQNRDTLDAC